jgi:HEPN domain-containing protein
VNAAYELMVSWIAKAENDYKAGWDEMQTDKPATDMICYHMQQCVEKLLKAYLVVHATAFRKTHDIAELIEQCRQIDPEFDGLYASHGDSLTGYGVQVHDPADLAVPTIEEAETSVRIARSVRDLVKTRLYRSRSYAALVDS